MFCHKIVLRRVPDAPLNNQQTDTCRNNALMANKPSIFQYPVGGGSEGMCSTSLARRFCEQGFCTIFFGKALNLPRRSSICGRGTSSRTSDSVSICTTTANGVDTSQVGTEREMWWCLGDIRRDITTPHLSLWPRSGEAPRCALVSPRKKPSCFLFPRRSTPKLAKNVWKQFQKKHCHEHAAQHVAMPRDRLGL